eukprot:3742058-Heterocapsa_arctica.AAC.2
MTPLERREGMMNYSEILMFNVRSLSPEESKDTGHNKDRLLLFAQLMNSALFNPRRNWHLSESVVGS